VVSAVKDKWKDLGVQLLDPVLIDDESTLDAIEKNHPCDVDGCCKSMLDKWLKTQVHASWKQLIESLKAIGLNHLASQIEQKLKGTKLRISSEYVVILWPQGNCLIYVIVIPRLPGDPYI